MSLAVSLSLALGAAMLSAPSSASAAVPAARPVVRTTQVNAPVPDIEWGPCDFYSEPTQCAVVKVPLDYDKPKGATVPLDLLRVPATGPGKRVGTLFVNPGGPGGSSTEFAAFFGEVFPRQISASFDVVGIDPRGVGQSAPMLCNGKGRQPFDALGFPINRPQARKIIRANRWVRNACLKNPKRIVNHMTTADTARDMDLIRQAVGDDKLTYYGVSYGSQLGTAYAAMFPQRVRALIVDGVIDPIDWTTGHPNNRHQPMTERLGSGRGAWLALSSAFRRCDAVGRPRCKFAGNSQARFNRLMNRLERGPIKVGGGKLRYQEVVDFSLGALYSAESYPFLMDIFQDLYKATFKPAKGRQAAARSQWDAQALAKKVNRSRGLPESTPISIPVGPYAPRVGSTAGSTGQLRAGGFRFIDPFYGVACADSNNPRRPGAWVGAGLRADRSGAYFGRYWTWASNTCAGWSPRSKADRFTGPWRTKTANPLLVVGNTFDPATPIPGARSVNRLFEDSRLVTYNGWGHGALFTGGCINRIYRDYLIDKTLPPQGKTCQPERALFPRRR